MSSRFTFRLSRNFISNRTKEAYQKYIDKRYNNVYDDIIDLINSTVQEITIPGINIIHPTLRKFKKSSQHSNEIMNRDLVISMRRIDGNINLYPIIEEAFFNYNQSGKDNLFIGDCLLECRNERGMVIFELDFKQCVLTDIDLPEVDYRETEPAEENFSITIKWNELNINPLPDFQI